LTTQLWGSLITEASCGGSSDFGSLNAAGTVREAELLCSDGYATARATYAGDLFSPIVEVFAAAGEEDEWGDRGSGWAFAESVDQLRIIGGSGNGTLEFSVYVVVADDGTGAALPDGRNVLPFFDDIITGNIGFVFGEPLDFRFAVSGYAGRHSDSTAWALVQLESLRVLTDGGQLAPRASVIAASGVEYPLENTPVPEPSTLLLMLTLAVVIPIRAALGSIVSKPL
jgi:hypothetical protein